MFSLKTYQQQTLKTLKSFLDDARVLPVAEAFEQAFIKRGQTPIPYRAYDFGEIPYVCLRLPTGGGKTVLASYAVKVSKQSYLEAEYPIVLWLVPTNVIRAQTLEALKTPGHPYRAELEAEFGLDRLRVLDIDEVTQIRPQDIGNKAVIVVGTLATLRVEDTSGRKVYAYHEDFEPHFVGVDPNNPRLERVGEADLKENGLGSSALGKIKYSFANLLALHGPLVIMDEAHNARTRLTFDTLKRIHPRCIIEFTATPDISATSASNVLYSVSASELKAEEMIKLPIMLTEHSDWQAAVRDAVLNRKKLALEAQKDSDYIRPIVLFQAEPKNGEVTVIVLKAHLITELAIEEDKIAVATGKHRELEGVDLFSRGCPIEYIITIEALKEGWDCSFAYIFCSIKDVRSSKDAEQLLGRVLRMPYARRRKIEGLNRAYAHLASPAFSQAAQQLTDKLVNMGFEALEVPAYLQHGTHPDLFNDDGKIPVPVEPTFSIELPSQPDFNDIEEPIDGNIKVSNTDDGRCRVEISGVIDDAVGKVLGNVLTGVEKKHAKEQITQHNLRIQANKAPSQQGTSFASLPTLCHHVQGQLELIEPTSYLYLDESWSLLDFPAELPNFSIRETETTFEVDIDGKRITYHVAEDRETYNLNMVDIGSTDSDLSRWLDSEVHQPDVSHSELISFLTQLIGRLIKERGFTLTSLVRGKFVLARAIREQIDRYRNQAAVNGFQKLLFEKEDSLETTFDYEYQFKPGFYPARIPFYQGRFKFSKHYYPVIEDLRGDGEEFECAKAIDSHPMVKHWVRNLVNREQASFRLPLAGRYFYPDFVVELTDGRLLVVEYKGEVYKTNDDSREKNTVGKVWASKSEGKCLYLMALEQDDKGQNVFQQINDIVSS